MGQGQPAQITLTVDAAILRTTIAGPEVLLIQRGREPYVGYWALPGGKVDTEDHSLDAALVREVQEETGITLTVFSQVGTFGDSGRDPRGRYVSVLYVAVVPPETVMYACAGDDAVQLCWCSLSALPVLAFDHSDCLLYVSQMLKYASIV